ncbi:hypothetical protein PLESTF_001553600 [Pleodorina starrii]|nr:hypothetical protein PLESTF_001553600 [Pleodorina starrii]
MLQTKVQVTPTAPVGRAKLFYRVREHALYATLDLQADAADAAEAREGRGQEGAGGVWRRVSLPLHPRSLVERIRPHHQPHPQQQNPAPAVAELQAGGVRLGGAGRSSEQ